MLKIQKQITYYTISFIFVLADDHRVVLRREGEGNDFINASYIAVRFTRCLFVVDCLMASTQLRFFFHKRVLQKNIFVQQNFKN